MGSRLEKTSNTVRKRIENHTFDDEEGDEYKGSAFGGFSDYFRRKKIKLQNLDAELRLQAGDKPQIFRGIVAHVNGYTQPSLNDLHKLIVQHGGGFMQYLDGKTTVTHIIASSLTPKKAVEFKRYRIVKPAWVVESVKAGRLLPWDSFRVLDEGAGQRVLGFDNGKVVSQASLQSKGYRDQTKTSWYTDQLQAESSTPRGANRPLFLTQAPTPDKADEIDDLPPSLQLLKNSPNPESRVAELPVSPSSSPLQQTPQLLRDLRQYQELLEGAKEQEPNGSPTPQNATEQQDVDMLELVEDEYQTMKIDNRETPRQSVTDSMLDRIHYDQSANASISLEREDAGVKRHSDVQAEGPSKRIKMTAEEHNAALLSDSRIRKSTVVNPEFLEQYYRESRLHHLSTWKADLKSQLQAMAEEKTPSQKVHKKKPSKGRRYILHVDFDSFFAAVSLKKHPQYKDKPAAVAHGGGSGSEIASCNYPARKFGVSNGMWMKRAQDLCPDLKVLPYDFPAYEKASRAFYEAIIATGGIVQSVSIDEALVDVSSLCFATAGTDGVKRNEGGVLREEAEADKIAQQLRDEVKAKTECDVSVGIGGNILLAKVALRKAKPAGQYHIRPEEVLEFIGQLEVTSLPGVAYSIGSKLEEMGIRYVKDIREFSKEKMMTSLGPKTGEKLWEYARGIDRKEVGDVEVRKSVSAEVNWGVRFYNQEQVDEFIESLCGELNRRLLKECVKGRQLSLKVMKRAKDAPLDPPKHLGHGKCDTFNKSLVLGVSTNSPDVLTKETLSMLKSFGFTPGELRGIGVQMTKLEPLKTRGDGQAQESSQRRLQFKMSEPEKPVRKNIDRAEDPIEDIVTPKKPKAPPDTVTFGAQQLNQDSPSRKPLNTLGTQFLLPSQVDPQVLAELPEEIRSKLAQHMNSLKTTNALEDGKGLFVTRSPSTSFTALPNQSQLDIEILDSLPDDVRSEVLSLYNTSPNRSRTGDQAVLPQSPRKNRSIAPGKRPGVPAVRRRGRPSKFDVRSTTNNATLTQSNFIAARVSHQPGYDGASTTDTEADEPTDKGAAKPEPDEPDPEFLAALPEDIRREVIAEHRRQRLQKASGLHVATNTRRKPQPAKEPHQSIQRLLKLPARPPRPTFTGRKLSALPELRDAISEWAHHFREEGPYTEDADALGKYLSRVIGEEGDMNKAVAAANWFAWVVEEELVEDRDAKGKWAAALEDVKKSVQEAVRERGLGKVEFR